MTRKQGKRSSFPKDWTPSTDKSRGVGRPKKGLEVTIQARINSVKEKDERDELRELAYGFDLMKADTAEEMISALNALGKLNRNSILTTAQADVERRIIMNAAEIREKWLKLDFPEEALAQLNKNLDEFKAGVWAALDEALCASCRKKVMDKLGWSEASKI